MGPQYHQSVFGKSVSLSGSPGSVLRGNYEALGCGSLYPAVGVALCHIRSSNVLQSLFSIVSPASACVGSSLHLRGPHLIGDSLCMRTPNCLDKL